LWRAYLHSLRIYRPAQIHRRLALLVHSDPALDPFDSSLFLFCGKRSDRSRRCIGKQTVRAAVQALGRGSFRWPRTKQEAFKISAQQFRWLMEGLEIEQPKALKPCERLMLG
jgi:transposase